MKKNLSIFFIFILILCTFSTSLATENKDYEQAALMLKEAGVLNELRLEENLKRQDMVIIISRLYKEEENAKNYKGKHGFEDISDKNYDPYIAWAVNKGLIEGFSPTKFGFNENVKVQEFQTVILRALDYKEEAGNWSKTPDIYESLELMKGISANPKDAINRGLMAKMTVNALEHTLKGGSLTLAQKLDIHISASLLVEGKAIVEKTTFRYEGKAPNISSLKLGLKLISEKDKEEENRDIKLDPQGNFIIEVPNLKLGKYQYRFISEDKSTNIDTFNIISPNVDKM